ncbi:MAG: AAA family ATPase [bacterium]|nr:AAA family ATPase [bacterium]
MKDYRSRFGFHSNPFTRELAHKDRFSLEGFDEAIEAVLATLDSRMSCALIAPAGTGKTSVLRAVIARLPEARYRTHYVKVTGLSKRDMCREIAQAIGLAPAGTYPTLVRRLQSRFSETAHSEGLRPVLILDEAHDLKPDTLAMLRVLTNFDMDSKLVVSIVLAGQPKLRVLLRRDDLVDVAGRMAHYATLRLLSRDEIDRYVEHRCTIAGAIDVPFDKDAVDALYEIGRGNLRATDQLARKALEIAHHADQTVCGSVHVAQARKLVSP